MGGAWNLPRVPLPPPSLLGVWDLMCSVLLPRRDAGMNTRVPPVGC